MRSVCGQVEMGKPLEDMGFDTIASGIVVASKVEEYRRVLQLPRNFCVSVCGEYLITGWECRWSLPGFFLHFGGRGCGCASMRALVELATYTEKDSLPNVDITRFFRVVSLAFTAMGSRELLTIVRV